MIKIKRHTGGLHGWTVDHEADAAYLLLTDRPVSSTIQYGCVAIDLDSKNRAVGVELLTLNPQA